MFIRSTDRPENRGAAPPERSRERLRLGGREFDVRFLNAMAIDPGLRVAG